MVKTNKKSLIAMIAMVVLLIASIAMGITGAWFTAQDDAALGTGGSLKFGEIAVSASAEGKLQLKHNGGDYVEVTAENTLVMPGDYIKGAKASFAVTTNDDCGFYYIIKKGTACYKINAKNELEEITDGNAVKVASESTTLTFGDDTETQVPTTTDNDYQGTVYSSSVYSGTYTLLVIQAANMDAVTAYTQLSA